MDLTTYEIETVEGAVWQEAFPDSLAAFVWAVNAVKGDSDSEFICHISSKDDTVTGVVTVRDDRIRTQHHLSIRPHRLNARVAA